MMTKVLLFLTKLLYDFKVHTVGTASCASSQDAGLYHPYYLTTLLAPDCLPQRVACHLNANNGNLSFT